MATSTRKLLFAYLQAIEPLQKAAAPSPFSLGALAGRAGRVARSPYFAIPAVGLPTAYGAGRLGLVGAEHQIPSFRKAVVEDAFQTSENMLRPPIPGPAGEPGAPGPEPTTEQKLMSNLGELARRPVSVAGQQANAEVDRLQARVQPGGDSYDALAGGARDAARQGVTDIGRDANTYLHGLADNPAALAAAIGVPALFGAATAGGEETAGKRRRATLRRALIGGMTGLGGAGGLMAARHMGSSLPGTLGMASGGALLGNIISGLV